MATITQIIQEDPSCPKLDAELKDESDDSSSQAFSGPTWASPDSGPQGETEAQQRCSPQPLVSPVSQTDQTRRDNTTPTKNHDMQEYDSEPVALEELLQEMGPERPVCLQHDLHDPKEECNGSCLAFSAVPSGNWTKKDLVLRGMYRPWFYSRFAKGWIGLSRQNTLSDIRTIMGSSRSRNKEMAARERDERERQREQEKKFRLQKRNSKRGAGGDSSSDEGDREPDTWVGCDECGKWRKVPSGVSIDADKAFFCRMLPRITCDTPEEDWDEQENEWLDDVHNDEPPKAPDAEVLSAQAAGAGGGRSSGKRKLSSSSPGRDKKSRRYSPSDGMDEPLSPEDITTTASSLYTAAGNQPSMSRLTAVVRVLTMASKPLHYDLLTRQALKLGLIKFTGSQGTAGESMKAFLNKTIRENKTAAIINLGKGVYGLKEWSTDCPPRSSCSPQLCSTSADTKLVSPSGAAGALVAGTKGASKDKEPAAAEKAECGTKTPNVC